MSLLSHARAELERINFGREDTAVMLAILTIFFNQWDSGGAVWAVAPILRKLIAGQPLSPLTGADDEWVDHGYGDLQNKRCGTVFKDRETGLAHDIDAKDRFATIEFPYSPPIRDPSDPVVVITTPANSGPPGPSGPSDPSGGQVDVSPPAVSSVSRDAWERFVKDFQGPGRGPPTEPKS